MRVAAVVIQVGAPFAVKDETTKCEYPPPSNQKTNCKTTRGTKAVVVETTHRWRDSDVIFDAGTSLAMTTNDNKQ